MTRCNIIGPQVKKLREERRWTQRILSAKLQIAGLDISRSSLAKIEADLIKVNDFELFYFACVFNVGLCRLFPSLHQDDPELHDKLNLILDNQE